MEQIPEFLDENGQVVLDAFLRIKADKNDPAWLHAYRALSAWSEGGRITKEMRQKMHQALRAGLDAVGIK